VPKGSFPFHCALFCGRLEFMPKDERKSPYRAKSRAVLDRWREQQIKFFPLIFSGPPAYLILLKGGEEVECLEGAPEAVQLMCDRLNDLQQALRDVQYDVRMKSPPPEPLAPEWEQIARSLMAKGEHRWRKELALECTRRGIREPTRWGYAQIAAKIRRPVERVGNSLSAEDPAPSSEEA
jgi:hypothetical protein